MEFFDLKANLQVNIATLRLSFLILISYPSLLYHPSDLTNFKNLSRRKAKSIRLYIVESLCSKFGGKMREGNAKAEKTAENHASSAAAWKPMPT